MFLDNFLEMSQNRIGKFVNHILFGINSFCDRRSAKQLIHCMFHISFLCPENLLSQQSKLAPFKTFFWCMSLRTGCLVLGGIGLVDTLLFVGLRLSLLNIISIGCSGALVYGVVKKNRKYLWPYLLLKLVLIFAIIMLLFMWIVATPVFGFTIYYAAIFIAYILLACLWFWIVYSHNVELREVTLQDEPSSVWWHSNQIFTHIEVIQHDGSLIHKVSDKN